MTNELFVKMILTAWNSKVKETDALLDSLTDEQLMNEAAPGRNRGIYLLGHLAAANDNMLPLLDFGSKLYPQLNEVFISNPDRAKELPVTASELRGIWKTLNSKLTTHFNTMSANQWFERHTSVSPEDFEKEPHRNKLNIIISRTSHLAGHLGQMLYLKS